MSQSTKNIILRVFGRFHAFEEKQIVKTVNLKIWKFSFSVHFSKMSSRREAKLITIYRIPWFFIFHLLLVSMQYMLSICDFMFRKSVSQ